MNPTEPTAKQQVLDWVRSKNPQTMELKEEKKAEFWESLSGMYWRQRVWSAWNTHVPNVVKNLGYLYLYMFPIIT